MILRYQLITKKGTKNNLKFNSNSQAITYIMYVYIYYYFFAITLLLKYQLGNKTL